MKRKVKRNEVKANMYIKKYRRAQKASRGRIRIRYSQGTKRTYTKI